MQNQTEGDYAKRKALMCDIIDVYYQVMSTFAEATRLGLVVGANGTRDRFLLSDTALYQPLAKKLHRQFLVPIADKLALMLKMPTQISLTLFPSEPQAFPSYKRICGFALTYPPVLEMTELVFNPKTSERAQRLTLSTSEIRRPMVPPLARAKNNTWHRQREDRLYCIDSAKALLPVFWAKTTGHTLVSARETGWIDPQHRETATHIVEDALFGMRDFLHSAETPMTYEPKSYRQSIMHLVDIVMTDAETPGFKMPYNSRGLVLDNPGLMSDWQECSESCRLFTNRPDDVRSLYPSFVRHMHFSVVPYYDENASYVEFMNTSETLSVRPRFTSIEPWNAAISLAGVLDCFTLDDLEREQRESQLMLRTAAIYYKFMSALRNLCAPELLAIAI